MASNKDQQLAPAAPIPPKSFGCLLFPGFQALDVFGPLDALNILSLQQDITLSLLAKTLDPVSTAVHARSTFSQSVLPTHTFATAPLLDVLIVPGGLGTRAEVEAEIEFIRTIYPSLKYIITVCTGALLAARAGILDGKKATTNKAAWAQTKLWGPNVHWVPHARWVTDGNLWTAAGVSAGIDIIFAWMAYVYGEETADRIANAMEYERHTDPNWDPFADLLNLTAA